MKKKNRNFTIALTVLLVLLYNISIGQTNVPKRKDHFIAVLADGRNDSILVRWAPSSTFAWQLGNKYGYKLERFTIQRDGKPTNELLTKTTLTIDSIKPLPKDGWQNLIAFDERAAIVQSGIYNEDAKALAKNASIEDLMKAQQDLDMRMGFSLFACDINMQFAKAAGLLYVDKAVKKNERYIYRITIANKLKAKEVFEGLANIGTTQKQVLNKPTIQKIQWGNKIASISWDTRFDKGIYSAYYLEKSLDGKNFSSVSELPLIAGSEKTNLTKSSFDDSLINNQSIVYYRLKGLTPFGEIGISSEVKSGHGNELLDMLPIITSGKGNNEKRTVRIVWTFQQEYIKDLLGFQILRAEIAEGAYSEVNPKMMTPNDTLFIDNNPNTSNYYKVKAMGKDGEIAISFPYLVNVYDAEPPLAPTGIKGIVNDSGFVVLKWKQNKEKDLLGYRIFKANNLKEEFIELSRDFITKNTFNDTVAIKTLTKEVYYKVVAVDQNFNNSNFSEAYELKKPDLIPPTNPLLSNFKMEKYALSMDWTASASDDVIKYTLQRVDKKTYDVYEVMSWNPTKIKKPSKLIDSTAVMGNTYYYQILAYDDAGNSSFGRTGELEFETGVRKPITDFKAVPNFQDRKITLVWSYDKNYEIERYVIYRCKKGEPMEIYQTLLGNKTYLEEKNLPIGNYYQYQIKGEIKGGLRTEISKVVEVKY